MNELFHRFISEEKNLEDEIIQSISEYEMNIASLNLELGHPVYTYRGSHLLIVKEKILKEEHTKLKYQKEPIYCFLNHSHYVVAQGFTDRTDRLLSVEPYCRLRLSIL